MECLKEAYNEKIEKNILKIAKLLRSPLFSGTHVEDVL